MGTQHMDIKQLSVGRRARRKEGKKEGEQPHERRGRATDKRTDRQTDRQTDSTSTSTSTTSTTSTTTTTTSSSNSSNSSGSGGVWRMAYGGGDYLCRYDVTELDRIPTLVRQRLRAHKPGPPAPVGQAATGRRHPADNG
eukprot:COSAG02_NODE_512_length_20850_cov_4.993302_1_plen_139_part_00